MCPSVRHAFVILSLFGHLGATYGRVSGLVNLFPTDLDRSTGKGFTSEHAQQTGER